MIQSDLITGSLKTIVLKLLEENGRMYGYEITRRVEELTDDLIDHVCCDVEYEMQQGLTFPEAYRRVKQKMGFRRLKEIQEETLYAVDFFKVEGWLFFFYRYYLLYQLIFLEGRIKGY